MIDEDGFRHNVGIVLSNQKGQLFWGRRVRQDAWQFPQGGISEGESISDAMYRELYEEVGLERADVRVIAQTKDWLHYRLPRRLVRNDSAPVCIGQKQHWFLLSLQTDEKNIKLDTTRKPEFDDWRWVSYWYPLHKVISFKKLVYWQVLNEFLPNFVARGDKANNLDPLGLP